LNRAGDTCPFYSAIPSLRYIIHQDKRTGFTGFMMNYDRAFAGQPALPEQPMIAYGKLTCPYTGVVFSDATVDAYNRYTKDFNATRYRSTQEFLLDQRHKFITLCAMDNLKEAS
tara:strand:- start:1061 stop:1402 length:342 start_codon:yes stop_codon:yes gene_type:complete